MTLNELRKMRAKLISDARALVDGRTPTAEENTRFDSMMDEAMRIKAQIDRIEAAHAAEAELAQNTAQRSEVAGISAAQQEDEDRRSLRVFTAYLRDGMNGVAAEDREFAMRNVMSPISNAQGTTPGSAGGYLVPPEFSRQLLVGLKSYFSALNYFTELSTATGADISWPTNDDTSRRAKIIAENTQIGTGNITFGQVALKAYQYATDAILVPYNLMQDSFLDLDSFIRSALVTSFGRTLADDLTFGSGTSQPTGVLTAAADGPKAAAAALAYDDFVELVHSVDPAYRQGGVLMMNDNTIKSLAKLKDTTGRPLWVPAITEGAADMVYGRPVVINQSMPDVAPGKSPVLFGNMKNYIYRVVKDVSIVRLNERYADYLQVGFFGYGRFGGGLPSAAQPIKKLTMPAAGG